MGTFYSSRLSLSLSLVIATYELYVIFWLNSSSTKLSSVIMFYIIFLSSCSFNFLLRLDLFHTYNSLSQELGSDILFFTIILYLLNPSLLLILILLYLSGKLFKKTWKLPWLIILNEASLIIALFTVLFTLFVVLTERKLLAYAMRRVGPILMGRNGAFQIVFDLVKLVSKETFLIPRPTTTLAPIFLVLLYCCQLLFSQTFIWGPSMFIFDGVDSMILYHLILILFGNIFFTVVGLLSQSRYAIIATARALVHVISLDIFITIVYSLLAFSAQSVNFHDFVLAQNSFWFIILYGPVASSFIVIFLLESKRTPFDHAETESEVVAGYQVEYSGSMLLMIFLAEYLHLVIASVHFILFFVGGWYGLNFLWFLPPCFLTPHDTNIIPLLNLFQ